MTGPVSREALLTSGIDVGARSVKIAILAHHESRPVILAKVLVSRHGRHDGSVGQTVIREGWNRALAQAGLAARDIDYVVSTGARDLQLVQASRYTERSSHALGARLLFPDALAALDIGTREIRCALLNESLPGHRYALTRPDAGCGSEMLAAEARGAISIRDEATRQANAAIQDDLAASVAGFLRTLAVDGKVVLTGGMVLDADFVCVLWSRLLESESNVSLLLSPDSIFAGAYGAAILAARRFLRISQTSGPAADPVAQEALHIERERRMLN